MTITKRFALAFAAAAAFTTAANAGGFSRGSANLDGLYAGNDGTEPVSAYMGATYVAPGRSADITTTLVPESPAIPAIPGAAAIPANPGLSVTQDDLEFSEDFAVPFASLGLRLTDAARCVGSYSEPYGADSEYEGAAAFSVQSQSIDTFELGLTCSYGFNVGRGTAYAIGGVFYEDLRYQQARDFRVLDEATGGAITTGAVAVSTIDVESEDVGFRLGAAYEIPEIALRASLIYRSETNHEVEGEFNNTPFQFVFGARARAFAAQAQATAAAAGQAAATGNLALAAELQQQATALGALAQGQGALAIGSGATQNAGAFGDATLPQSLELNVQTGINPSTLVFGSIRWTDWSVIERIDLNDTISGNPFTDFEGFFRDGYTVTLGVGRKITEDLSASLAGTWDRGVGTGFDTFSDTWTLSGGVAYDLNELVNLRAGGAVLYFTEAEQTEGDFRAVADDEFGFALSGSMSIKF